ncbi:MAG TPA: peptide chain release factor N(5)-glutamine methyltransferase [Bacteroidia bacterium]|nr:peptide chain release factor N(5)-glutamine methyltransferase [Bacteroidia bacterium]
MDQRQLYLFLENHLADLYTKDELNHLIRLIGTELPSKFNENGQVDSSHDLLIKWVEELKTGKPIQYVIGKAWFMDMELLVGPDVLIPRPETEELVELIASREQNPGIILDIGTGSGCISLALQKRFPATAVFGTDISDRALEIAKMNGSRLGLSVQFLKNDILTDWKDLPDSADILVSNPPYIPATESDKLSKSVTFFEPATALFVPDQDPLLFYRHIHTAGSKLKSGGRIYLEVNQYLAQETAALFANPAFSDTDILTDISGNPRFVVTSKC